MPEWVSVCRLDEVPAGRGCSLDAAGLRLAVFRIGDQVVALSGGAVLTPTGRWDMAGSKRANWSARCTIGGSASPTAAAPRSLAIPSTGSGAR